jgi:hypothetical protein
MKYIIGLMAIVAVVMAEVRPYTNIQIGKYGDVVAQEVRFGLTYETKYIEPYIEHLSVLSAKEKAAAGMNIIGVSVKSPVWQNAHIYGGGFGLPKRWNRQYFYNEDTHELGYRFGVKYAFKQLNAYIERFNGDETVVGLEWRFN